MTKSNRKVWLVERKKNPKRNSAIVIASYETQAKTAAGILLEYHSKFTATEVLDLETERCLLSTREAYNAGYAQGSEDSE